ncbi:MAG: hypothetical protein ABL886_00470 [Rhodoglobus sp.]
MGINNQARATSIGTSPFFILAGSTTAAYSTTPAICQLFIDINLIAAGDEFKVKLLEKIDGSTVRTCYEANIAPQSNKGWVSPQFIMHDNGWDWSVEKVSGTDRALPIELRYVT